MAQFEIEGSFVLDSSVVIKWFCNENDTNIAIALRDNYTLGNIAAAMPDLLLYETANALHYNPNFSGEEVSKCVQSIIDMGFDLFAPNAALLSDAISLSGQYSISVYDSSFLALARSLERSLITADEKLYNRIKEKEKVKLLSELPI